MEVCVCVYICRLGNDHMLKISVGLDAIGIGTRHVPRVEMCWVLWAVDPSNNLVQKP